MPNRNQNNETILHSPTKGHVYEIVVVIDNVQGFVIYIQGLYIIYTNNKVWYILAKNSNTLCCDVHVYTTGHIHQRQCT